MNKSQLIDALAARYEGNRKSAQQALESVLDTITREVARGEKVAITGFGSFEKRVREARWVRNPQTGARIKAKKTAVPKFTAGADLKNVVSGAKKLPKLVVAKAAAPAKKAAPAKAAAPAKKTATKSTAKKAAPGQEGGSGEEGGGEEDDAGQEGGSRQEDRREDDDQEGGSGQEGSGEEGRSQEGPRQEGAGQEGNGQEGREEVLTHHRS